MTQSQQVVEMPILRISQLNSQHNSSPSTFVTHIPNHIATSYGFKVPDSHQIKIIKQVGRWRNHRWETECELHRKQQLWYCDHSRQSNRQVSTENPSFRALICRNLHFPTSPQSVSRSRSITIFYRKHQSDPISNLSKTHSNYSIPESSTQEFELVRWL